MSTQIPKYRIDETVELSEPTGELHTFEVAGSWACDVTTKDGKVHPATLFKFKKGANHSPADPLPPLLLLGNGEDSPLGASLWAAGAEVNEGILQRENLHIPDFTGKFTARPFEGVTSSWTAELTTVHDHQKGAIQAREIIRKGGDPRDNITGRYQITPVLER